MRWVIGDVHGMLRPLRALLDAVYRADASAELFFVGDYVNRGPDSRGVIDLLLSLKNAHFARGNHDDIFDMVLHGQSCCAHPDASTAAGAFAWFIQHGLWDTLASYGLDFLDIERVSHRPSDQAVGELVKVVPEAHRQFIRSLPPVIETNDFFVVHAMWNADDPDEGPSIAERLESDPKLRRQALWGRFTTEIPRRKRWRRIGYFGHTPVQTYPPMDRADENTPIRGPKIVLVDTGAAVAPAGRLTALCAEDDRTIQVDRVGEVLKQP